MDPKARMLPTTLPRLNKRTWLPSSQTGSSDIYIMCNYEKDCKVTMLETVKIPGISHGQGEYASDRSRELPNGNSRRPFKATCVWISSSL